MSVKVTYQYQSHIVGYIPRIEELNEFAQSRVLQVFGFANDVALVCMTFVDGCHQFVLLLRAYIACIHIVLLKHVLQLCLEGAEDGVLHSVGVDGQPFVHLVCRERAGVAGHVV